MAAGIVDAELGVRGAAGAFTIEIRVNKGKDSDDVAGPFPLPLDEARLRALAGDADRYGQALSEMLFSVDPLRDRLVAARATAEERAAPLRLRLALAGGAESLHALRWELLRLPGRSEPLCTREDILFSRFLPGGREAALPRPRGALKALVAIASPADLEKKGFAPVDLRAEAARAQAGLAGLAVDWLPGSPFERCTAQRLAERIPAHDVLYLVCHGRMIDHAGWLLLENDDGSGNPVPASYLARRLAGAAALPRLAVLVVCESAGGEDAEAAGALGPCLVDAGIPAVVAMHGSLTFDTAARFLPPLFQALQADGAIDRAVSVGRRSILDQPDEYAPVLFMNLKSGLLWAMPAASEPAASEPAASMPAASMPADQKPGSQEPGPAGAREKIALYDALSGEAFTLDDLEELVFQLGVDWDNLRGETKPARARAIIRYFAGRGREAELRAAAQKARPNLEIV